ncbi:hypothetical protein MANES_10G082900v8 [Manihot esculenta]|uniref:Uncharacterized protein n=1 Tax=Manihot esculenta TaxID=3983 RepID=A0ACB7GZ33_MANES|nr:hypothetical protein MANES_10G082900v8 [Manihot esculenta]
MLRASKWLRFSAGELILRNCSYKKPLLLTTCFCSPPAHECLLLQRSISSSSSGICGSYSTYLPWKNPRSRTSSAGTLNVKNFLSDSGFFSAPSKPPSAMLNGRVLFSSSAPRKPNGNQDHGGKSSITTAKSEEKQVADMKILRTLVSYLWMKDNYEFRLRVITAFAFLVGAKVLNVQVPFLFKLVVDWLTTATGNAPALASFTTANSTLIALFATPASVLIGYGIARCGASAFNELRTAVFSKVALRTIRQVSRKVFPHLHDLDLRFHLSRETGAPNRIIDRGSRGINFILSSMVLNVVPTILEISMVSGILAYKFGAPFAWITSLSVAAYVAFTLFVTQKRKKIEIWRKFAEKKLKNRFGRSDLAKSLTES